MQGSITGITRISTVPQPLIYNPPKKCQVQRRLLLYQWHSVSVLQNLAMIVVLTLLSCRNFQPSSFPPLQYGDLVNIVVWKQWRLNVSMAFITTLYWHWTGRGGGLLYKTQKMKFRESSRDIWENRNAWNGICHDLTKLIFPGNHAKLLDEIWRYGKGVSDHVHWLLASFAAFFVPQLLSTYI